MSLSREVDAVIDALLEKGVDYLGVGDVGVDEGITGIPDVFLDVVEVAGVGQLVEVNDLGVRVIVHDEMDEVGADEAGSACD